MSNFRSSSATPVILEGDDDGALTREALRLASEWIGEERKVLAGLHVDVSTLTSEAGAIIKVDEIRAIRRDALLRPFDGDVKVYIIERAHQMNGSAQNAFLRLLEEPPESVRFVLLTQNAGMLLPTVRSRCVLRRLPAPERTAPPEKKAAAAFVDALEKPWERAVIAYSWDKQSRDALKGTLRAVLACLRDRCLRDGIKPLYIETMDTVSDLLPALDQNASVGTVCGVLAIK